MKGKHFNLHERFYIEKRIIDGVTQATIARELGLSRSTVSRELKRNTDPAFNGLYSCRRADTLAKARRMNTSARNELHQQTTETQAFIRKELALHTSPAVISGRLRLKHGVYVSKNTLYRYIKRDRLAGGKLYLQLPHRGKYYRYGKGEPKRSPIPDRVGIEERPAEADLKQQPGHFEIDTVFGKDQKSFLLTLADKATRQVIIRRLPNKRAETVVEAFRDIMANTFCHFKTLTADNGSEFSMHKQITEITGADVFFARPYHSWERGLNEHSNGLIRRFYPKGTDFNQVTDNEIAEIEHILRGCRHKMKIPRIVYLTPKLWSKFIQNHTGMISDLIKLKV